VSVRITRKEADIMVYAFMHDVPIDEQTYRKVANAVGEEPMDGLVLHLCVRNDGSGGLRYIEVWESEEKCTAAYEQRIQPAMDKALDDQAPSGPDVTVLDVLDIRGTAAK
jgi:hypothetical protein